MRATLRMRSRSALISTLVVGLLCISRWAEACPSCAGSRAPGDGTSWLVGLFLLVPPMLVLLVLLAIRRDHRST